MSFSFILEILPDFLRAAGITLALSVLSALMGAVLGFTINAAFLRASPKLRLIYRFYVWVLRGTPFLVQLFIVYYGLPSVGLKPSALEAAFYSLTIYASAYFAEIFRASWASLPKGQAEAAETLGINRWHLFWRIQTPQALRFSLPLLTNQTLLVVKESALASIITVPELTMTAGRVVAETFNFLEPYLLLALFYWLITYVVVRLGLMAERRIAH
ncbi:amino acid ABC transporter permease [Lampropedia aestuarii]|uniref:amino acid ABC transporter permease n=1 Tax=Lampropedia aestuarii TaxID=2562762 RepID=UPI0024683F50|nr:amino acid ABC transporter permease [Lampropedia aestuarii]MDH5856596.1 amino acid ABC transporter permease [Lampropedia aestuarii]